MKWLCAILLMGVAMCRGGEPIPVTVKAGRSHVSARAMEKHWGVAVKRLPGTDRWVACLRDRCALVEDHFAARDDLMIGVDAVMAAMSLKPDWSDDRLAVGFVEGGGGGVLEGVDGLTQVGELAPNFRLPRLDGSGPISLGDLRGKRVLINSWASW